VAQTRLLDPRNPGRLDDVAGVVRGFCFELAGSESRSGVDMAAEGDEAGVIRSDAGGCFLPAVGR
jgi:hypothetical protein